MKIYCETCQAETWHNKEDLGIGWNDFGGNIKIDLQIEWVCEDCGDVNYE